MIGFHFPIPTEAQGYRTAACGMFEGARPLLNISPVPVFALTLICGHGTEAALKALLAQSGVAIEELRNKPFGHDLVNLWNAADKRIPDVLLFPRPLWVEHLNRVHAAPHNLRYPIGFHAIVLPNQLAMVEGLEQLVRIVNEKVE